MGVAQALVDDAAEYDTSVADHQIELREHADLVDIGQGILRGDLDAYQAVLDQLSELTELTTLGEELTFSIVSDDCVTLTLDAHSDEIIPDTTKNLLASGKLSEKKMPIGRRFELYQDHVCSAAHRAACNVFALLPVKMTIVTVIDQLLNSSTGYQEDQPILSVAIPRSTLDSLNLDTIDPSESMSNFVHNMAFMKTKGFKPVDVVDPSSLA